MDKGKGDLDQFLSDEEEIEIPKKEKKKKKKSKSPPVKQPTSSEEEDNRVEILQDEDYEDF